ncbi:MAG: hypothetical protein ACRC2K_12380 [Clostridium sp.]
MDIYIYRTFKEWLDDTPTTVIDGDVKFIGNGAIAIDASENYKTYRQFLSFEKNFAIIYKLPYGFLSYPREINFFESYKSWEKSSPELTLTGEIIEEESNSTHVAFITQEGYKEYISLNGLYAVTYER